MLSGRRTSDRFMLLLLRTLGLLIVLWLLLLNGFLLLVLDNLARVHVKR